MGKCRKTKSFFNGISELNHSKGSMRIYISSELQYQILTHFNKSNI
ncbi:hypothetical protein [Plasmodium yoelii yoelii]|uniref:Uncharacterized protein n=1 Tax=Plasmodium yoelii yoelii TaxID=73239 RepID=Q7RJ99_PLAYO|nr:hypothetical protein [Plasmodium yoelii yoelii]